MSCRWIALSKCVTLINSSHNELLQVVWDYDWDRSDADVRAYSEVGLLSHGSKTIVFSNSKYLTSSRQNQKNPFGPMASSEMQVPYGQIEDFQPQCFPLENHPWNKKLHSPPYSRNFKLQFLNLISHDQSRKTLLGPELNYCGWILIFWKGQFLKQATSVGLELLKIQWIASSWR